MVIYYNLSSFKITLTSPELIIKWSSRKYKKFTFKGEVTEPLTIDIKTGTPYLNGLFCERIFGSIKTGQCFCGNIKINCGGKFDEIIICDKCLMEVTNQNVRRHRIGYIKLEIPIANKLYLDYEYNIISLFLNITDVHLKNLLYYKYLLNSSSLNMPYKNIKLNTTVIMNYKVSDLIFITTYCHSILYNLNILKEISTLQESLFFETSKHKQKNILKKLQYLKLFFFNNINPSWMFITILPVLPVSLRPYKQLTNKTYVIEPINELYKIILTKNNRLRRWTKLRTYIPVLFEVTDKKNLQQSIDLLFATKKQEYNKSGSFLSKINKNLTNLTLKLQGKYGMFRQQLLGKRVDFSSRAVITPQPSITLKEIGIPLEIALTLYKPKIIQKLKTNKLSFNFLSSVLYSQYKSLPIKYILHQLLKTEIVLINRAPTLHRMNLQAFKPILSEGETVQLYPLACAGFNADFDGDQMGLFGPLSSSSKKEAKTLLISEKNVYSPATGTQIFKPTQSTILGIYSFLNFYEFINVPLICSNIIEINYLYEHYLISVSRPIWIKLHLHQMIQYIHYKKLIKFILTTPGKSIIKKNLI